MTMQNLRPATAVLKRQPRRRVEFSLNRRIADLLHAMELRRQSRRGLDRLLADPHLARDVGLSDDQIRGELIRLRRVIQP